jgi:alkylation response protein AidB-like acyl-CoA dehydrogenase
VNFDFSDEQRTIKATARELLASRSPFERVRAAAEAGRYDDDLWRELRELGWPGIAVAEEHGGQGLGAVELAVLLEELGYAVAAVPLLGSALAALAIEHAGDGEQRARWLPGLASGELTGALGGVRDLIADAADADVIVLVEAGAPRVVARADADVEPVAAIDPTRRYARVRGDGPALAGDVEGALGRAGGAVAAEVVGVCQRALDMTVAYVSERRQFGVPVGSFQAVSHRCAQMLLHTEGARSAAYFAAWAADAAPERLAEACGMACAAAGEAGVEVTGSAIQAHGGIGFTWEADVHWLYKRAQLDAALLGSGSAHRIALARRVAAARPALVNGGH